MYLHLGVDSVVRCRDIIGIFDLDNTTVSKITRETLNKSEKNGETVTVGYDIPKSFVVCAEKRGENKVYISPVTPATLTRRIKQKKIGAAD
ncbi:MAG: extracellular matrix regulator RemB [Acutalibacteraceae bacterium]